MMESIPALRDTLDRAFEQRDLDAFICALVLHSSFARPELSAWADLVAGLLQLPAPSLQRSHDVAVAGVRLALGDSSLDFADYAAAAKRELAREPMPPAACCRDDERLLIGVCAGAGKAAPELVPVVAALVSSRGTDSSPRQRLLDIWAEALAMGAPRFTSDTAHQAMRYFHTLPDRHKTLNVTDQVALLWLCARLLDAPWRPSEADLEALGSVTADSRRAVLSFLAAGHHLGALDAALLTDALSSSPRARMARLTILEGVLGVVDQFVASVSVLQKRQRDRPPLPVDDEYDLQDLIHALLLPVVPDIVPEDPAPKVAGKSSRLDFTSRAGRLGIETKYVRDAGHAVKVREEILIDESTYQTHPYIQTVVAFVYDPDRHIPTEDRAAFEADLSQTVSVEGRAVQYVTRVR